MLNQPGDKPYVALTHPAHHPERELQSLFLPEELYETRDGCRPRLAGSRRPSRQWSLPQMRSPCEPCFQASLKELTTPDGAVGTVAGPVERYPDDVLFVRPFVVREAACDVRVVVLDANRRQPGLLKLPGVLGREIIGVQVIGN